MNEKNTDEGPCFFERIVKSSSISSIYINQTKPKVGSNGTSSSGGGATVWVLLSRHIVKKELDSNLDDAHDARGGGKGNGLRGAGDADDSDSDFIACHVYNNTGGRRVYTPNKPMIQGVYHSDPHILVKIDVPTQSNTSGGGGGAHVYTLVISQLKKKHGIDFTLNALCTTASIKLCLTPQPPKHILETKGMWNFSNSGGPLGNPRFYTNPQYSLAVKIKSRLHIELLAPKDLYVGLRLVKCTGGKRIDTINKESHQGVSLKNKISYHLFRFSISYLSIFFFFLRI